MALSTGRIKFDITAKHTITSGIGSSAADASIEHKMNLNQTVPSGTGLPATVVGSFSVTQASSTAFIDMTAIAIGNGATADCTGLKLQCLAIKNPTGNGTITLSYTTATASSAYNFAGTSFSANVPAGGSFVWFAPEAAADVSTSAKNIVVAGTGSQSFHAMVIAG